MVDPTIDTIRALLEEVIERTDDTDVHFDVRTALQLLTVLEERDERVTVALRDADAETRRRLRELGYLE